MKKKRKHYHNWQKGYYQRCEECDAVVEGDNEPEEENEVLKTCPKCGREFEVVCVASDYYIWGCPEHKEFDSVFWTNPRGRKKGK